MFFIVFLFGYTENKQHLGISAVWREINLDISAVLGEINLWILTFFIQINLWIPTKCITFAAVNQKVMYYDIQAQTL
ncbi:MAG: hypothetical protein IJT35_07315 [Paludibacteraceae bacterium]|nr:hypothetical protein [Paludibacteraceae bacterium]